MEHPTFTKAKNGTLILKASDEAKAVGPQRQGYRAKQPEEVEAEARAHVASEGGDVNNATLVLSQWKVQFGTYQGKTFHWLLQNDVGYAVMVVVASHQKEQERTGSQSPLMANKDAFTRYSLACLEFAEAVRFRQAFEEARVKSLQPGQEGLALVGFGDFKFESLQSQNDPVCQLPKEDDASSRLADGERCLLREEEGQTEGGRYCCCWCCHHLHPSGCILLQLQQSVCLSFLPGAEGCISVSTLSVSHSHFLEQKPDV
ncbi:uncharacterized protein [Nothobranchius furzeri]|uniref:uncharacterized protein isoform X2 n=1 Tax=Nothobranchius furzeri TaxID=105023 RepID=UPI003904DF68